MTTVVHDRYNYWYSCTTYVYQRATNTLLKIKNKKLKSTYITKKNQELTKISNTFGSIIELAQLKIELPLRCSFIKT